VTKDGRKLLSFEREKLILDLLDSGYTGITELSDKLGVSEATIRRDLLSLEENGCVKRVHGGAIKIKNPESEPIFIEKAAMNYDAKEIIANLAVKLIDDSDIIYLDGGSTVQILAKHLGEKKGLTIVTNSLMAAVELFETDHKVIIVGGEFRRLSRTVVGSLTRKILNSLKIKKAFLGTIGFSVEKGMTTTDPNEAYTKELVMNNAEKVFVLADSSKIGRDSFAVSGNTNLIDALITDKDLEEYIIKKKLSKKNINIIVPEKSGRKI